MTKGELRLVYRAKREELSDGERDMMSLKIANNALRMDIWDKEFYHIFLPSEKLKEVNTEYLLNILAGKDKHIVIPKVNGSSKDLNHVLLTDGTKLVTSRWGIPEPESGVVIEEQQLDVVFVPLLASDQEGNRLGYGKGYYDRFLAKCRPDCLKIGLSFFEPGEILPNKYFDIKLNSCITSDNFYVIK